MRILVTGGAGFIGSAVVRQILSEARHEVVVLDKFTYAASLDTQGLDLPRLAIRRADICNETAVDEILTADNPDTIMHLAAETHVDRSIDGPAAFIATNVTGTRVLLDAAVRHWRRREPRPAAEFRFLHVSTDEVFGSLGEHGLFTEESRYDPRSPYSASKAASDHLARAWYHTYGLPVVLSNCSNNYGAWQFPEKLIPLTITSALNAQALPVYGTGDNVRDWLYVDDHARALVDILTKGRIGESYNVGARAERKNLDVVRSICRILDEFAPRADRMPHESAITFVTDRPGHDHRYAMDPTKLERELGWQAKETFDTGLRKTVAWYLEHRSWCEAMRTRYDGGRLGLRKGRRLSLPAKD